MLLSFFSLFCRHVEYGNNYNYNYIVSSTLYFLLRQDAILNCNFMIGVSKVISYIPLMEIEPLNEPILIFRKKQF